MTAAPTGAPPEGDRLFRDRVRERDLDNFLVEELHASPDFLSWVLGRLEHRLDRPDARPALEKSPPREQDRRQTDVRIGWFDKGGDLVACVLVESKVTAEFQPGQAQSYAGELAALRSRLGSRRAVALLVAPGARLSGLLHDGAFDAELAVEDIADFLASRRGGDLPPELDARLEARIQLLEALCGKRQGTGWIGVTLQEKRDFAEAYADLAAEMLPGLRVRPSTDGPRAITRIFEPLEIEGLARGTLRHEFGSGEGWKYANILFSGAVDRLPAVQASEVLNGTEFTAEPAGKSLALRVRTPAVDPTRPFDQEREAVGKGLEAIRSLIDWTRENALALGSILRAGVPSTDASVGDSGGGGTSSLERAFEEALLHTYRECEKLDYRPTGMLGMIDEHGGVETARRLLAKRATAGLARLAMLGRLDLSIERIVLEDRWRPMFTDAERAVARKRLR